MGEVASLLLTGSASAWAVKTERWELRTPADYLRGKLDKLRLTSDGELAPGFGSRQAGEVAKEIWCTAPPEVIAGRYRARAATRLPGPMRPDIIASALYVLPAPEGPEITITEPLDISSSYYQLPKSSSIPIMILNVQQNAAASRIHPTTYCPST